MRIKLRRFVLYYRVDREDDAISALKPIYIYIYYTIIYNGY